MKTPKHSLRKIVNFLNNPDEDGGFWLPNIQRPFVWSEVQICRFFDSILREYPIGTLLIWKTRSTIKHRKFIDNYRVGLRLADFYVPENQKRKCLVLDGQQRLQSLFIALCGSYEGREFYFDILSGELAAPDDIKYKFEFFPPEKAHFPWIKFKDLVFSTADPFNAANNIVKKAGRGLTEEETQKVGTHVGVVFKTFHSDDGISYQELDSTEDKDLYSENDVVEVFIRANSGGTRLGKSDLLFALLSSTWDHADEGMEDLLETLNRYGFEFTRDFILKTCLTLLDAGSRYEVEKFRKEGVREKIEAKWEDISKAIMDVLDFVRGKTFITSDKALPSYLVLIPLVYVRYHFPDAWKQARDMDIFLLRSLLAGAFSGTPDQLIDDCVVKINELKGFDAEELFGVIRSKGRSLELTTDRFWQMGYGSNTIHLLFNLWYHFDYTPAYENNLPQVDHIFPQSLLKKVKVVNPQGGTRNVMKYRDADRNQLANCMLLTAQENLAGGKSDTPPDVWFADKDDDYLDMHLIPKSRELWKLDRFEDFIVERKKLIAAQFADLLVGGVGTQMALGVAKTAANAADVKDGPSLEPVTIPPSPKPPNVPLSTEPPITPPPATDGITVLPPDEKCQHFIQQLQARQGELRQEVRSFDENGVAGANDVVVVPAQIAWPEYQQYHAYICQADRPFRPVKRIAFYSDGQIYPLVPTILESYDHVEFAEEHEGRLGELVKLLLAAHKRKEGTAHKVVLLSPPDSSDTLKLDHPIPNDCTSKAGKTTAFVQNQRYVSSKRLKTAKTTSDLVATPNSVKEQDHDYEPDPTGGSKGEKPRSDPRKPAVQQAALSTFARIATDIICNKGGCEILRTYPKAVHFIPVSWAKVVPENGRAWKHLSRPVSVICWSNLHDNTLSLGFEVSRMDDPKLRLACVEGLRDAGFSPYSKAFRDDAKFSRFYRESRKLQDSDNEEELRAGVEELFGKAREEFPKAEAVFQWVFAEKHTGTIADQHLQRKPMTFNEILDYEFDPEEIKEAIESLGREGDVCDCYCDKCGEITPGTPFNKDDHCGSCTIYEHGDECECDACEYNRYDLMEEVRMASCYARLEELSKTDKTPEVIQEMEEIQSYLSNH